MAKKTLQTILQCPTDFLYLWASDGFISQLGSKSKIVKEKKYNQYQTLWKTMVENTNAKSQEELQEVYKSWTNQIASAIKDIYGLTPAQILEKLAMGEEVLGRNWDKGVYGIGAGMQLTFDQTPGVGVDYASGKITYQGVELENQTPIYGADGNVTGYSAMYGANQYQSYGYNGAYGAYSYSTPDGVIQNPTGNSLSASGSSFWQNSANYMPIIERLLDWIMSFFGGSLQGRTVLTQQNTAPKQTEWVSEESDNGGLLAGGLVLGALAFMSMDKPKNKKKKQQK